MYIFEYTVHRTPYTVHRSTYRCEVITELLAEHFDDLERSDRYLKVGVREKVPDAGEKPWKVLPGGRRLEIRCTWKKKDSGIGSFEVCVCVCVCVYIHECQC